MTKRSIKFFAGLIALCAPAFVQGLEKTGSGTVVSSGGGTYTGSGTGGQKQPGAGSRVRRVSPAAGLTMSLSTSGYSFLQSGPTNFTASVAVVNRTKADIALEVPAGEKFVFRMYDANNVLVWDSNPGPIHLTTSITGLNFVNPYFSVLSGSVNVGSLRSGILHTGVMAIGGETTGTVLDVADAGTFELDFSRRPALATTAGQLDGKAVNVWGTLAIVSGVEIAQRRIITVYSLSAVPSPATDPVTDPSNEASVVSVPVTIAREQACRATVAIPLTVSGVALPVGSYRLEASFGGAQSLRASTRFDVTAPRAATP